MFWNRKNLTQPLTSHEYEELVKRFTQLMGEIEEVKVKFKILETNYDNLRGQFNRKLKPLAKEEENNQSQLLNTPFKIGPSL